MIESLMVTGRPSSGRPSPECARRRSESAASRAARSLTSVMTAFRAGLSASIRLKNCWVSSAAETSRALSIATSRPAGAKNSSLEKPMGHLSCSGGSTDSLPLSKDGMDPAPLSKYGLVTGQDGTFDHPHRITGRVQDETYDNRNRCGKRGFRPPWGRRRRQSPAAQADFGKGLLPWLARLEPCLVGMEACGSAHYWARELEKLGHMVRLMSPQFVTPYRKGNKNDPNDAEAICEAVTRPSMRFVPIKRDQEQDMMALHRVREQLIKNRTALANQIRGLLRDRGIIDSGSRHPGGRSNSRLRRCWGCRRYEHRREALHPGMRAL